jgi:hypothetical protein
MTPQTCCKVAKKKPIRGKGIDVCVFFADKVGVKQVCAFDFIGSVGISGGRK